MVVDAKVKVLETEECLGLEGEVVVVPTKVEINGREYTVEMDEPPFGEIHELTLEDLKDLKLGDIPSYLTLNCETTKLGWLKLQCGYASLEMWMKPKYWRGNISIDNYLELLKDTAVKNGFKVINDLRDENNYMFEIGKEFSEDTTVEDAYREFQKVLDKVSVFENVVNTLVSVAVKLEGKGVNLKGKGRSES